MAGDWIKVELDTPDKPEVHQIANELEIDPDAVVGKLIRVWSWFDKHTVDGNAFVTLLLLDRIAGVTGFARAMHDVGWLWIENDHIVSMVNFERHNGKTAKRRALGRSRVQKHRSKCNADVTQDVTHQAYTDALPEKRREENIGNSLRSLPISLPLNDKSEYPISDSQIAEWGELYPATDVLQELRKMRGWLQANPANRKTKRGILRFVTSWLSRAQDRGGSNGSNPQPPQSPGPPETAFERRKRKLGKWQSGD